MTGLASDAKGRLAVEIRCGTRVDYDLCIIRIGGSLEPLPTFDKGRIWII